MELIHSFVQNGIKKVKIVTIKTTIRLQFISANLSKFPKWVNAYFLVFIEHAPHLSSQKII